MATSTRAQWTKLTDVQLLDQCAVDTYRASGPGGQKRNKTSSAVRLRHPPSGLMVIAEESRSQHENKARALRRLRQALYLKLRAEWPGILAWWRIGIRCSPWRNSKGLALRACCFIGPTGFPVGGNECARCNGPT